MNGELDLFQGIQQALQTVGQGDGRGGIGQQEGAGDQQHDAQDHLRRPLHSLPGQGETEDVDDLMGAGGEEQVQNARKRHDHHDGLQTTGDGFEGDGRNFNAHRQESDDQAVGQPARSQKQRHDVDHDHKELAPVRLSILPAVYIHIRKLLV